MVRLLRVVYRVGRGVASLFERMGMQGPTRVGRALWLRLAARLKRMVKRDVVEVRGHTMYLDPRDSMGLAVIGVYENAETDLLHKSVRPGATVVDLGAHIGYYTLLAARLAGSTGSVIAFEPDPQLFELLSKNVQANGYANVTLVNSAVSAEEGRLRLHLSDENSGMNRIYPSRYTGQTSIEVPVTSLDAYFAGRPAEIDFIKMDIEGAEWAALEGMSGILDAGRPMTIMMEYAPCSIEEFGADPARLIRRLGDAQFAVSYIAEDRRLHPVVVDELLARYTPERENSTTLFCVR